MSTINPESILQQLRWRYAVKTFDSSRKIPAETMKTIEQALVLAPSSYGLQPWKFLVITDPAVRAKLKAVSWNQSQITDASHLVVLCRKHLSAADVDAFVNRIVDVRKSPRDALKGLSDMMHGSVANPANLPGGSMETYTRSQVYIALGVLLSTAAMLGIDACPMEGFDPKQYDSILNLPPNLHASVVCTLGYRSSTDWLANLPKVRFEANDVITHI